MITGGLRTKELEALLAAHRKDFRQAVAVDVGGQACQFHSLNGPVLSVLSTPGNVELIQLGLVQRESLKSAETRYELDLNLRHVPVAVGGKSIPHTPREAVVALDFRLAKLELDLREKVPEGKGVATPVRVLEALEAAKRGLAPGQRIRLASDLELQVLMKGERPGQWVLATSSADWKGAAGHGLVPLKSPVNDGTSYFLADEENVRSLCAKAHEAVVSASWDDDDDMPHRRSYAEPFPVRRWGELSVPPLAAGDERLAGGIEDKFASAWGQAAMVLELRLATLAALAQHPRELEHSAPTRERVLQGLASAIEGLTPGQRFRLANDLELQVVIRCTTPGEWVLATSSVHWKDASLHGLEPLHLPTRDDTACFVAHEDLVKILCGKTHAALASDRSAGRDAADAKSSAQPAGVPRWAELSVPPLVEGDVRALEDRFMPASHLAAALDDAAPEPADVAALLDDELPGADADAADAGSAPVDPALLGKLLVDVQERDALPAALDDSPRPPPGLD